MCRIPREGRKRGGAQIRRRRRGRDALRRRDPSCPRARPSASSGTRARDRRRSRRAEPLSAPARGWRAWAARSNTATRRSAASRLRQALRRCAWIASRAISYMDENGSRKPWRPGSRRRRTRRASGRAARAGGRAVRARRPRGTARARGDFPARPRTTVGPRPSACRARLRHGARAPLRRRPLPRYGLGEAVEECCARTDPAGTAARAALRVEDALVAIPELHEDVVDRGRLDGRAAPSAPSDGLALAVGEHDDEPLARASARRTAALRMRRQRVEPRRGREQTRARRRLLDAERALDRGLKDVLRPRWGRGAGGRGR